VEAISCFGGLFFQKSTDDRLSSKTTSSSLRTLFGNASLVVLRLFVFWCCCFAFVGTGRVGRGANPGTRIVGTKVGAGVGGPGVGLSVGGIVGFRVGALVGGLVGF